MPFLKENRSQFNFLDGIDYRWNVLTLTPYLRQMWDTYGLIGFRPLYIDWADGAYLVVFTFHWLLMNRVYDPGAQAGLHMTVSHCKAMVEPSPEFRAKRHRIWEAVRVHKGDKYKLRQLEDGQVCQIRSQTRSGAENMMRALELRWVAGRLFFLAGAAGGNFLEALDYQSD